MSLGARCGWGVREGVGGGRGGALWDARQAGHWPRYSKKSGRKDFKRYKTLIPQMFFLPKVSLWLRNFDWVKCKQNCI